MKYVLIVVLFLSCKEKQHTRLVLSQKQIDTAISIAKRFNQKWFDSSYSFRDYHALSSSIKDFLILPQQIGCRDNIKYKLDQLRTDAHDTANLICVYSSRYNYDLFLKKENLVSIGSVYMDTTFRVLLVHCDSGLVYRYY